MNNKFAKYLRQWPSDHFDLAVTLSTAKLIHTNLRIEGLKDYIKRQLFPRIEREFLGKRFNTKEAEFRILFIGVPEHITEYSTKPPHYHLLVKFPRNVKEKERWHLLKFVMLVDEIWDMQKFEKYYEKNFAMPWKDDPEEKIEEVVKDRYYHVQSVYSQRGVGYVGKDLEKDPLNNDHIIFHNATTQKDNMRY